jgi:hypothetical protein
MLRCNKEISTHCTTIFLSVTRSPAFQPAIGGPPLGTRLAFVIISMPVGEQKGCRKAIMASGRRLTEQEEEAIRRELAELRQEHRDLDAAIAAMDESAATDTIRIQRLKKRKLALKDRIAVLEDQLLPDIIA